MARLPLSWIPSATRMRELSKLSPDGALMVLAKHIDLPMDDSETVSFLRHALNEAQREIRRAEYQLRIDNLSKTTQRAGGEEG